MSDWWPGSSTQQTPVRSTNQPFTPQPKPRFAGDELDPQDAAMAENVKFYPTFGSTPAGKAFQGGASGTGSVGSPGASGNVGVSPGGARRSPQHRFSLGSSPNDAMSPRNRMTGRTPFPNAGSPPDDDLPPTLSLRDNPSSPVPAPPSSALVPTSSSSSGAHTPLPLPPSLQPTAETTALYVFGPPPEQLPHLLPWLSECGQVESYHPAVEGGWYYQITYASPIGASYALRRHGDIVGGKWMVGFKIVQPGQTVPPQGATNVPGGRLVVKDQGSVMKPKPADPAGGGQVVKKEGYAWDDNEQTSGVINRAAEWLFGR